MRLVRSLRISSKIFFSSSNFDFSCNFDLSAYKLCISADTRSFSAFTAAVKALVLRVKPLRAFSAWVEESSKSSLILHGDLCNARFPELSKMTR